MTLIRKDDRTDALAADLSPEYHKLKSLHTEAADQQITDRILADRARNLRRANAIAWIAIDSAFTLFCVFMAPVMDDWTKEIAITRDITECPIAHEASARNVLATLRSRRSAMDRHALIDVTDLDGTMIEVNDSLCFIRGAPTEELPRADHRIFSSARHPKWHWDDRWTTIPAGKVWRAEDWGRC